MATQKQRAAARKNIKKAARAAKRKQTLKHLPKKTRRALGQQAAKSQTITTLSKRAPRPLRPCGVPAVGRLFGASRSIP